jgi:hypothetical protein
MTILALIIDEATIFTRKGFLKGCPCTAASAASRVLKNPVFEADQKCPDARRTKS